MLKYLFFSFLTVLSFSGCVSTEINPPATNGFFDLSDFIEKDLEEKKNRVKKLQKTIILDGATETKDLDDFDLAAETELFTAADINKVAWLDRYKADSLFYKTGQLKQLVYTNITDDLRTKRLVIHYNTKHVVDSILVEQSGISVLSKSIQKLRYLPASGYRIENQQDITALDQHKLTVDVKFVY